MSLKYLLRPAVPADAPAPLLVLLHGYGSHAQDLFAWAERVPPNWTVIAAEGPMDLGAGRHAWYEVAMVDGKIRVNAAQAAQSVERVAELIGAIAATGTVDPRRVVVAGFSQGANLAQAVALSHPALVARFAVFSGRWVDEFRPLMAQPEWLRGTRAFVAHGSRDHMLPVQHALENRTQLAAMGLPVTYVEDSVSHTISQQQFEAFVRWMEQD